MARITRAEFEARSNSYKAQRAKTLRPREAQTFRSLSVALAALPVEKGVDALAE